MDLGHGLVYGAVAIAAVALLGEAQAAGVSGWRRKMLDCARGHLAKRTLYQWGGGHGGSGYGLDCSGLVIQCAKAADIVAHYNADGFYKVMPKVDVPQPGDLALYGRSGRATHIRIVEKWKPSSRTATVIGSDGGDKSSTSPEVARAQKAWVKRTGTHLDRGDFLGFRTLQKLAGKPVSKAVLSKQIFSPPN
ncbi:MAG: NlpC/P60 family protein [Planctomycetota bacterium]|jgi:hypothetical protein